MSLYGLNVSMDGWKVTKKPLKEYEDSSKIFTSAELICRPTLSTINLHMNPSVIQFSCVSRHVTSALMCFPERPQALFILVILHNSANTPTTKTTQQHISQGAWESRHGEPHAD